jgi:hypothetical protein
MLRAKRSLTNLDRRGTSMPKAAQGRVISGYMPPAPLNSVGNSAIAGALDDRAAG